MIKRNLTPILYEVGFYFPTPFYHFNDSLSCRTCNLSLINQKRIRLVFHQRIIIKMNEREKLTFGLILVIFLIGCCLYYFYIVATSGQPAAFSDVLFKEANLNKMDEIIKLLNEIKDK